MHHTLGGLRYVVNVSNGLPSLTQKKLPGFAGIPKNDTRCPLLSEVKKSGREHVTLHIFMKHMTWIDLIYRENHHHQHHHGLWPLTDYCFPKVWKSSPCSLVWQMFDQNGRSKIEENLQKVSPPWKLKNTSFFKEPISTKKQQLHLLENPWNGSTFWRCFFFCSVFFPRIGSGLHPIFFTLWLFSLSGKHSKQKDQRRKVVGVDWSSICLLLTIILKTNVEGTTWTEISQKR